jgi:hypothetical protein
LKLPETGCDPGLPPFIYKDYRDDAKRKETTILGEEFVRRFVWHILPPHFIRVRHRGFLATRVRTESIASVRVQLGVPPEPPEPVDADDSPDGEPPELKPPRCPHCGAKEMVWERELLPKVGWIARRYSHFAMKVKGAGFGLDRFRQAARPP